MSNKYTFKNGKNGKTVEISEELHEYFKKSDRKIRYIEKDLKCCKYKIDMKKEKVTVIASREDSLDRLMDIGKDYPAQASDFRESLIEKITLEQALEKLSDEEHYLITQLFYLQRTERDLSEELGISQSNVNKRKHRILVKLHKFLK